MNRKILYIIFTVVLLCIPIASCKNIINNDNELIEDNFNLGNTTFLIGTIYNPIENGSSVKASAISLVYYNKNILDENIGLVQGFKQISFIKNTFFLIYKPGPLGLIAYVFGNCLDFKIG